MLFVHNARLGLILSALSLPAAPLCAQSSDPLITDRPDFTESATAVRRGRAQVEAGYTLSREAQVKTHSIGEALVRVGMFGHLELRLGLNSFAVTDRPTGVERGFEDVSIGVKLELFGPRGSRFALLRPAVALLAATTIPTGGAEFGGEGMRPEVKLALAWDLANGLSLGSNLNYASASEESDRFSQFSGSLALGAALSDRVGGFVEAFGFASPNSRGLREAFLNGGVTMLANDDLQFDSRLGVGLGDAGADYFIGLGVSLRE